MDKHYYDIMDAYPHFDCDDSGFMVGEPYVYNNAHLGLPIPQKVIDYLRDFCVYDKDTGVIYRETWGWELVENKRISSDAPITYSKEYRCLGMRPAGGNNIHSGKYTSIGIFGKIYMAHRLAWFMHHGVDPCGNVIDHINRDKSDNRISNLRLSTPLENAGNRDWGTSRGASGFVGVTVERDGVFKAGINTRGRYVMLGYFATAEDAHNAYLEAKRKYSPGFTG